MKILRKRRFNNEYFFTSESVTGGHSDKMCDAILDEVLLRDYY